MKLRWIVVFLGALSLLVGCGESVQPAGSCSVTTLDNGDHKITCDRGTSAIVHDGEQGEEGQEGTSCTLVDNDNGTTTVTCGDKTFTSGFDCSDGYPGDIDIDGSTPGPALLQLTGCTTIQGDLTIEDGYSGPLGLLPTDAPNDNPAALTELPEILSQITAVGGTLMIANSSLTEARLPQLKTVGGNVTILSNNEMETLVDLPALESIGGELLIQSNNVLTELTGILAGTQVGSVTIRSNDALPYCTAQDFADSLDVDEGGDVTIEDNYADTDHVVCPVEP